MSTLPNEPLIGVGALAYYLKRIHIFFESDKKTISFPNITRELQDVLIKISTENTEFLNADKYSENVKIEAAKLAAALISQANIKLTHEFSDGNLGANVLMYKKTQVEIFKAPEPLRKPCMVKAAKTLMEPPPDSSVSPVFKTRCLNAATKFVKDDSELVMKFPEMNTSQAEFVMDMILPGTKSKSETTDVGFGFRSIYAPLWESMRVFNLKYEYKVYCDTRPASQEGMKRVIFEKVPKSPIPPTNTVPEVIDLDDSGTPEVIIDLDDEDINDSDDESSSSSVSLNKSKLYKSTVTIPKGNRKVPKKVQRLIQKVGSKMQSGVLRESSVHEALRRISEFVADDKQDCVVLDKMSADEQYFLANVRRVCMAPAAYMLFSSECQKYLDDIKYHLGKREVCYQIQYGSVVRTLYGSTRSVKFYKTSTLETASDNMDVETSESLNSSFSSKSSTSVKTTSDSKKAKSKNPTEIDGMLQKMKKSVQKAVAELVTNERKGLWSDEFMEKTLQKVCEFLCDEQQGSLVLQPTSFHQVIFIQKVGLFAREETTHRVFTAECKRWLAKINNCFTNKILYQLRQFKGRKDIILEKMAVFPSEGVTKRIEPEKKAVVKLSKASEIIDLDLYKPSNSALSSSSSTSDCISAALQRSTSQYLKKNQTKTIKDIERVVSAMKTGTLHEEFVYNTLKSIRDFMYNHHGDLILSVPKPEEYRFTKVVEVIARDETWHAVFSARSQTLLAELRRCFNRNMLYQLRRLQGAPGKNMLYQLRRLQGAPGNRVLLEKLGQYATKQLLEEPVNKENVNNTNITKPEPLAPVPVMEPPVVPAEPVVAPLSQSDQDRLIRLKAIKDTVAYTSGEDAIVDYLTDISNFLMKSNADRTLTFTEVTEDEALFLKNVHVMSKMEESYAMFPRECQKLLRSIRFNAHHHTLKCQIQLESNNKRVLNRRVVIEKLSGSTREKKEVQHRARSLSPSRRAAQSAANARAAPLARGGSSQRLSVKEQLKAALAQPVHCDKALRMMESMGWTGGALGARGDGIVEPISLPLDLVTRAGLGHVREAKKSRPEKKSKETKKSKEAKKSNSKLHTTPLGSLLPQGFLPVHSLPADVLPPGIILPEETRKCKTVVLDTGYRCTILRSILELVSSDLDEMHFICSTNATKITGFLKHAVGTFNGRHRFDLASEVLKQLVAEISQALDECGGVMLNAAVRCKTALFPRIAVVTKNRLSLRKSANKVVSLINDQQETNEQEATSSTVNEKSIWYQDTNDQDATINLITDSQKTTTNVDTELTTNQTLQTTKHNLNGRLWYFPVKIKQQILTTKIQQTYQIPELKTLALSAVCMMENLKTDIELISNSCEEHVTKLTTDEHTIPKTKNIDIIKESVKLIKTNRQIEKPNEDSSLKLLQTEDVTTLQKSKLIFKIPKLTRKQLAIKNQSKELNQRVAHKLEQQQYKVKKIVHTDAKVTKSSEISLRKSNKYKIAYEQQKLTRNTTQIATNKPHQSLATHIQAQDLETTKTKKLPGDILLEKLIVNYDDSIVDNNTSAKKAKTKNKTSVAIRLKNAVADCNVTDTISTVAAIKKDTLIDNTTASITIFDTSVVNDGASTSNSPTSSDDTDLICKRTKNMRIDDTESVTYVIPVETKVTIEKVPDSISAGIDTNNTNIVTANDKSDLKDNDKNHAPNTNCVINNEPCDEDNQCQIELNNSITSIVISSDDDEDLLFFSDDNKSEISNNTNIASKLKCKDINEDINESENIKVVAENSSTKDVSREVKKDNKEIDPDNFYDSEDRPALIQERKRPSLDHPVHLTKKCKLLTDFMKVEGCIVPINYPQVEMDTRKACEIQSAILKSIDYTQTLLPYLKCQGIQNGGLVYYCHDEKSLFFLETIVRKLQDLKIKYKFDVEEQISHKMSFKIHSYIEEPLHNILNRLELYNLGLNATKWCVLKKEQKGDFMIVYVEVDDNSFSYICEANFVLYAGNDCARFTTVWD